MKKGFLLGILVAIAVFPGLVQAGKMDATLLWKYDVRVGNENLFVVDLNGDGYREVIADAPQSGAVHALNSDGTLAWRYGNGTYFFDSYAANPDDKGNFLIVGMFRNVYGANTGGTTAWRRSLMSDDARSVYAEDFNGDHLLEYVVGIFSGMKGSFQILDSNGNLIKEVGLKGREIPYVIIGADVDGDFQKEVVMGGASYSVNTVAENYELVPGRGNLYVYESDGTLKWKVDEGVFSLAAGDLNKDKIDEILVGTSGQVVAYSGTGEKLWAFNTGGSVNSINVADVNNDSSLDVVAAAGKKVFLLDSDGKKRWDYSADTPVMSVDARDVDGNGNMEIALGSTTVEVISEKGEKLWESDGFKTMRGVIIEDINADSFFEIVSGCSDGWVRVFSTTKYAKAQRAVNFKLMSEARYDQMDYDNAIAYAEQSLALYEDLSDSSGEENARTLLDKIRSRIEADFLFNDSVRLFNLRDYENASNQAAKANEIYRRLSTSFARIEQLNSIIDTFRNMSDAESSFNNSVQLYDQSRFSEAASSAATAVQLYSMQNNADMVNKSEAVLNRSLDHIQADSYMAQALNVIEEGNTSAGVDYLRLANDIYIRVGDVNASQTATERISEIEGSNWKKSLRTYGWVVIAGVFVVGILLFVFIAVYFVARSKAGEVKLLSGKTDSPAEKKPEERLFGDKSETTLGNR